MSIEERDDTDMAKQREVESSKKAIWGRVVMISMEDGEDCQQEDGDVEDGFADRLEGPEAGSTTK